MVLADGTCSWDLEHNEWAVDATAVPAPLRGVFDGEPRWVDARWTREQPQLQRRDGRLIDLLAEIAAPVQGITKDALVGEELRQHRRTVRTAVSAASLLFVLAIAAVLGALLALDQRDKAESRRQQALSQSLAGQATDVGTRRPDLGILLAIEAWRHAHTSQAEQALINAAQLTLPAAERFRAPDNGSFVYELVAIPEHGYALAGRSDGSLTLWKLPALGQNDEGTDVTCVASSSVDRRLRAGRVRRPSRLDRRVRPRGGVGRGDAGDPTDLHGPQGSRAGPRCRPQRRRQAAHGCDASGNTTLGSRSAGPAVVARRQRRQGRVRRDVGRRHARRSDDPSSRRQRVDPDLEPHRRSHDPALPRRTRHVCRRFVHQRQRVLRHTRHLWRTGRVPGGRRRGRRDPHAGGCHHDADGRSARRADPHPRPLAHRRQWERERPGLERGHVAGARDVSPRDRREPERDHQQREWVRRVGRRRHDDVGAVRPRLVRLTRGPRRSGSGGFTLRDQRRPEPAAGGRRSRVRGVGHTGTARRELASPCRGQIRR